MSDDNQKLERVIEEGAMAIEKGEYKTAHDLILPYAESGDAEAQFTLALIYGWGYSPVKDTPSDLEKNELSLIWIRRAAIQGHRRATKLISDSYKNGWYGLSKNIKLSKCWSDAANSEDKAKHCAAIKP